MPGVVKTNEDTAGGLILPLQSGWTIGGQPIGVVGCPVVTHSPCEVPDPPHCAAIMAQGSAMFNIDGIPVCRAGDQASCGHPATGQGWFNVEA